MFSIFDKTCRTMITSTLYLLLFAPVCIRGVNIEIDGIIDLGPKWNYKYNIRTNKEFVPTKRKHFTAMESVRLRNDRSNSKLNHSLENTIELHASISNLTSNLVDLKNEVASTRGSTKYDESLKVDDIFDKPHSVKEDTEINEFMKHIFKQTLTVFETLKMKINDIQVKNKIDFLARSYETKFHDFVEDTQKRKIKTKLGKQKVILNTIDTSNRILKRLVNYLIGDIAHSDKSGLRMSATNVYQNEIEREIQMEYKHACVKYGICRNVNTFSDFLINLTNIILTNTDKRLKLATDALTEVVKDAELDYIMDNETKVHFLNGINYIETSDMSIQRAMFVIIRNILTNKNVPFVVDSTNAGRSVNKTVAFLNLIDILEKALPGNDANLLEWNDIKNSIREWSEGSRDDIMDIMQAFADYLKRAFDKLDVKLAHNVKYSLDTILSYDTE